LLRLLLPLSKKVHWTFRTANPVNRKGRRSELFTGLLNR